MLPNFFSSQILGTEVKVDKCPGSHRPALVHKGGMLFFGKDTKAVNVRQLVFDDGRMINACDYGRTDLEEKRLELTESEQAEEAKIRDVWVSILGTKNIDATSDFFKLGAGSMDVVRLVEEINFKVQGVKMIADDIYMSPVFDKLIQRVISKQRGLDSKKEFKYDAVELEANNMKLKFPHQLFINNDFIDALSGATFEAINPTDESVICTVAKGNGDDVEMAVDAAEVCFIFV